MNTCETYVKKKINKPSYYLDTAIFITYLKEEDKDLDYFQGVVDILDNLQEHEIVTSTVTLAEVLPQDNYTSKHPKRYGYEALYDVIGRISIVVDQNIGKIAGELRNSTLQNENAKNLTHFDSIHLASAIASGAKYLYTGDGGLLEFDKKEISKVSEGREINIMMPKFSKTSSILI